MADGSRIPIRKAALRRVAPAHITARELIRRYLHEAGQELQSLADAWGCKRVNVWRAFDRKERNLCPHHIEGTIKALQLDEFDANELRLRAAQEAGWLIDPKYLLGDWPAHPTTDRTGSP